MWEAPEKQSTVDTQLNGDSVTALSIQSSANKTSLSLVSLVLVPGTQVNSLSSVLYLVIRILLSLSSTLQKKSANKLTVNILLNSVGVETQPCLSPLVTGNAAVEFPLSSTRAGMSSWK